MSETKCVNCGAENGLISDSNPPLCISCYNQTHSNDSKPQNIKLTELQNGEQFTIKRENTDVQKQLEDAKTEIERLKSSQKKPTGTVQLNEAQANHGNLTKKGYDSYGSMYADLKSRETANDTEAKAILDKMFENMLNSTKQGEPLTIGIGGKVDSFTEGKSIAQLVNENYRASLKARSA